MKKAFTLIELMVVITIIGILASVVLVQFPGAVKRAKDSRVISSMGQLRTQSAILYANQDSFQDLFCEIVNKTCSCLDTTVEYLCNDIGENSDQGLTIRINSDNKGFCAVVHLQGSGRYFCVDGKLHAREYDAFPDTCSAVCQGQPADIEPCRCQ